MVFPATALDVTVELYLDAWTDITGYVYHRDLITITRGVADEAVRADPAKLNLTLNNRDGRFSPRNPTGAYYGLIGRNTPIRVSVTHNAVTYVRYVGEVVVWPPRWDVSGRDVWVPIEAAGITRRLGAGGTLRSALYRTMSGVSVNDITPDHYVPMEDGSDATQFAVALPEGTAAVPIGSGVSPGADSTLPGSASLPVFPAGAIQPANFPVLSAIDRWYLQFAMKFDVRPTVNATLLEIPILGAGSGLVSARLRIDVETSSTATTFFFEGLNSSGGVLTSVLFVTGGALTQSQLYGSHHSFIVGAEPDTPSFPSDFRLAFAVSNYADEFTGFAFGLLSSPTGAVGRPTGYTIRNTGTQEFSAGHFGLYSTDFDILGEGSQNSSAMQGHAGEQAHERFERICREEGIPSVVIGTRSAQMGPQPIGKLLDIFDDCAKADSGLVYEPADELAVAFRTNGSRYNQAVALALDYEIDGHVAPPLEPVDDDQDLTNDLTITRTGGSSGRYELTTGRNSVNDPPDGIGRYAKTDTVNLYEDAQTEHLAAWTVHVSTADEARYPSVHIDLSAGPSLIADAMAVGVADRVTIDNPPAWLPPDQIDLHALGYTETLAQFDWDIVFNATPAGPYTVAVYDTARYDSATTKSIKAITSGATTLDVACGDGIAWTTSGAQYPYDLNVAGERVTATACSNLTLTARTVGTAAHGNNAAVTPGLPTGLAESDVLMVLAAIRNSGTGTVDDEPGYTTLAEFGNVKLQAMYAPSGAAAPQITFTGGVAGADTSAQLMAFAACGLQVHNWAAQLNGSAQNIAYPALHVTRDNCLILYIGWKQDDWTSVTGPGTEIGEPDTTTGDDQGLVWAYQLQTAATDIAAGSFTVTGGTTAISRGIVIALTTQAQRFTITRAVNGVVKAHAAGTPVRLWNTPRYAL